MLLRAERSLVLFAIFEGAHDPSIVFVQTRHIPIHTGSAADHTQQHIRSALSVISPPVNREQLMDVLLKFEAKLS